MKTSGCVQIITGLNSSPAANTGVLFSRVLKTLPLSQKTSKSFVPKWQDFSALTLFCLAAENPFPWNSSDESAANINDRFASFAVICWTPHCPLRFSNKLLGGEEKMHWNPICSLLFIDFILSSFLMKMNHRFSSLPQPFSIQFCVPHPLDHLFCMTVPFESSLLSPTVHLSRSFLYRFLPNYSSLA